MAELKTSYRMYADIKKENIGKIVAKQNDTKTRYLDITVTDNGTPVDLTDCEVRIYGRKHDGTEFFNNGSLQDAVNGRCLFEATTQMLALAAQDVHCEVVVYKNNEQILSTMPFTIHVVESLIGESAIESSNEYGALVVLYQNLYEAIDLMTMMVKNFGEAGETAAQVPAETFWEMLEALYEVNQGALEDSVDGVHGFYAEMIRDVGFQASTFTRYTHGPTVVYNDEIHTFVEKEHYKLDENGWSLVSETPCNFSDSYGVAYDGGIHMFTCGIHNDTVSPTAHYYTHFRWDGVSWTELSPVPGYASRRTAVVYNNEIHLLGVGTTSSVEHYKWDGATWTQLANITAGLWADTHAIVFGNTIHVLGSSSSASSQRHYKWDASADTWSSVSTLPDACKGVYKYSVFLYQGKLNLIIAAEHYRLIGTTWEKVQDLPFSSSYKDTAVVLDGIIHIRESGKHYVLCEEAIKTYLLARTKIYHDGSLAFSSNCNKVSDNCYQASETGEVVLAFTDTDATFLIR